MGYTHYWRVPPEITKAQFEKFAKDVDEILRAVRERGIPVAWEHNEPGKDAEVTGDMVRFNGAGDDGHETFVVIRTASPQARAMREEGDELVFGFCKTACKPYDLAVTACLIALKEHIPRSKVSSDGGSDGFSEARILVYDTLSYGANFEVDND